jgi:hypothetical protein
MMKTLSAFAFGLALCAGHAVAADALKIQSEAQFQRDHAGRIERIAPGVYLITEGRLAGKTVAFGEAGLDYDIAALKERARAFAGNRTARAVLTAEVRRLEGVRAQQAERRVQQQRLAGAKAVNYGTFSCVYTDPFTSTFHSYGGSAEVRANAEHYLNDGNGFSYYYNYYGRAYASSSGSLVAPFGVPQSAQTLTASSMVHNRRTGQIVSRNISGFTSASAAAGYIYSGPTLMHDLYAFSSFSAGGSCIGYLSISDRLL